MWLILDPGWDFCKFGFEYLVRPESSGAVEHYKSCQRNGGHRNGIQDVSIDWSGWCGLKPVRIITMSWSTWDMHKSMCSEFKMKNEFITCRRIIRNQLMLLKTNKEKTWDICLLRRMFLLYLNNQWQKSVSWKLMRRDVSDNHQCMLESQGDNQTWTLSQ